MMSSDLVDKEKFMSRNGTSNTQLKKLFEKDGKKTLYLKILNNHKVVLQITFNTLCEVLTELFYSVLKNF